MVLIEPAAANLRIYFCVSSNNGIFSHMGVGVGVKVGVGVDEPPPLKMFLLRNSLANF